VWYTLRKIQTGGMFTPPDMRGRHEPHNKSPNEQLEAVRAHIKSFPAVDHHYSRANTNRKFLGCDLNITKMDELYVEDCKAKGLPCVKVGVCRHMFCSEFNLSFHHPKKDDCQKCEQYECASVEEKALMEEEYSQHITNKDTAREEKDRDKEAAKQKDSTVHAITMDLQSVLTTPCGNVSALYYAQKLAVYNFTILQSGN